MVLSIMTGYNPFPSPIVFYCCCKRARVGVHPPIPHGAITISIIIRITGEIATLDIRSQRILQVPPLAT